MNTQIRDEKLVVIIGAGPAGLTAAYDLNNLRIKSVVLEKDDVVGGISRTVRYNDYLFDIGGHRFFTKVDSVERMWKEVLGANLLRRDRRSRIFYNKKFFDYPLKPANALRGLGLWNSALIILSYIQVKIFPIREDKTFEDWISNRFGRRLYKTFFKSYTEKVWGIPCSQISAEWASQRIKGLSVKTALKNALIRSNTRYGGEVVKTLIDSFQYPKYGPGMMWETVAGEVSRGMCQLYTETKVDKIIWSENKVSAVAYTDAGHTHLLAGTHFISSMPVRELIEKLDPRPPSDVIDAAAKLNYRDFITVALIVDVKNLFSDNWIYIHDPDVKVGRVQNFKNWSPYMVPDPNRTCIGLEYFCFEGDDLWETPDRDLIELGKREMEALGLVPAGSVIDGAVVRMPKAYPVYDDHHSAALATIRRFLDGMGNLQVVGRNGMHKYNNQDHSMFTSMLAVKNIMGGSHDLWSVNVDRVYHEEVTADEVQWQKDQADLEATQPRVPTVVSEQQRLDQALARYLARTDKLALAVAVGIVSGFYVMLPTLYVVMVGGERVGFPISLLGQYFIGFTATHKGALIGYLYGFFWGFIFGWLIAYLRNAFVGFYVSYVQRKAEIQSLRDFMKYI